MNEFLREFIMQGIRNMIDNNIELYKVYQYAAGWYDKSVLLEEDLQEIQSLYADSNNGVVSTDEENKINELEAELSKEGE